MLGFAMRAGRVLIGTELICSELRRKPCKVKLVLVAAGVSLGTKKKITTKCEFYGVPLRETAISQDELGSLLGKTFSPAACAVCDEGFAREIVAALDANCDESDKATNRKEASVKEVGEPYGDVSDKN